MLQTHSCCQAGRQEQITGLEYHTAEPPPASAATQCMHWVSSPQVGTFHHNLPAFRLAAETSLAVGIGLGPEVWSLAWMLQAARWQHSHAAQVIPDVGTYLCSSAVTAPASCSCTTSAAARPLGRRKQLGAPQQAAGRLGHTCSRLRPTAANCGGCRYVPAYAATAHNCTAQSHSHRACLVELGGTAVLCPL